MTKRLILFIGAVLTGGALFLLRFTTMTGHIALSIAASLFLVLYAVTDRNNRKAPALDLASSICFLVAVISGTVMNVGVYNSGISIAHKIAAVLYLVLLIAEFIVNSIKQKNS